MIEKISKDIKRNCLGIVGKRIKGGRTCSFATGSNKFERKSIMHR